MKLAKSNGDNYTEPQRAQCGSTGVGTDTARVATASSAAPGRFYFSEDALGIKARSNKSMKPTRSGTSRVIAHHGVACGLSPIR